MNKHHALTLNERIMGGLWGSVVGDALGVPVEFQDRATLRSNPVENMRGFGSHNQPPGTWSDDSSLLLCSADSLVRYGFDTEDMGSRFARWHREELWTPHGKIFDIGMTTSHALRRIAAGVPAEVAGSDDETSNGNGSLMRILPVALRFATVPTPQLLDRIHRASAITHRHPRSQMACGCFALVIRGLLNGKCAPAAFADALADFRSFYESDSHWSVELERFKLLFAGDFSKRPASEIESGGYVLHTLMASLWCLLTSASFAECVLKAINLGGDTDTTGCVAGGLAGVAYGIKSVPPDWIAQLARKGDLDCLFHEFTDLCCDNS
jgi:ADP-ribosyl-[dinitrogen reductase] hydrolase